jgi:hypothetical protein
MNTHFNRMSEKLLVLLIAMQSQTIIRACRACRFQWSARRLSETDGQALNGIR